MAEGSTITPPPVAGQQGTAWMRWLDCYAEAHATAVPQMTVRDFPAWVAEHIAEDEDGETVTSTNIAIVVLLMARLGSAHGLRRVPISLEDAVMMTKALVLDHALATLRTAALIGEYAMDDPALGVGAARLERRCGGGWTRSWLALAPRRRDARLLAPVVAPRAARPGGRQEVSHSTRRGEVCTSARHRREE